MAASASRSRGGSRSSTSTTSVEKGEPLFELYSSELYDTQQQYQLAYRHRDQREVPFLPRSERDPERLLDSTRTRLEYYDITARQIEAFERNRKPSKTMVIKKPSSFGTKDVFSTGPCDPSCPISLTTEEPQDRVQIRVEISNSTNHTSAIENSS